jgi:TIR domain
MPTDYRYDVFFSYKRRDLSLVWTRQVWRRIEFWLTEELGGRKAEMFVDEECIESGDRWPEKLKEAVAVSRCMVCIWAPSYFQSGWCVSEWQSFRKREKILGLKSHGLIAPLRFHDGEHFPEEARSVQWMDVAPYAITLPSFWETTKVVDLEEKLKPFVAAVANIVRQAPPFRQDWPIVEYDASPVPHIALGRLR